METVFKFVVELLEKRKNQMVYDKEIKIKAGSFHLPMSSSGKLIEKQKELKFRSSHQRCS